MVASFKVYKHVIFLYFDIINHGIESEGKAENTTVVINKKYYFSIDDETFYYPLLITTYGNEYTLPAISEKLGFIPLIEATLMTEKNTEILATGTKRIHRSSLLDEEEIAVNFMRSQNKRAHEQEAFSEEIWEALERFEIEAEEDDDEGGLITFGDYILTNRSITELPAKYSKLQIITPRFRELKTSKISKASFVSIGFLNNDSEDIVLLKQGEVYRYYDSLIPRSETDE